MNKHDISWDEINKRNLSKASTKQFKFWGPTLAILLGSIAGGIGTQQYFNSMIEHREKIERAVLR